MTKRALITGITGQDGAYLAQLLHPRAHRPVALLAGEEQGEGRVRAMDRAGRQQQRDPRERRELRGLRGSGGQCQGSGGEEG